MHACACMPTLPVHFPTRPQPPTARRSTHTHTHTHTHSHTKQDPASRYYPGHDSVKYAGLVKAGVSIPLTECLKDVRARAVQHWEVGGLRLWLYLYVCVVCVCVCVCLYLWGFQHWDVGGWRLYVSVSVSLSLSVCLSVSAVG